MNGVHDLGGMHGFGSVDVDGDDELFHEPWEARAFGIQAVAIHGADLFNLHEFRHARERVEPSEYLGSSYYDNWLAATEKLAIEKGVVDREELLDRVAAFSEAGSEPSVMERQDPELTARTLERVHAGYADSFEAEHRFAQGDEVVVRRMHPEGHTRCPRYVRGCRGIVEELHDAFALPDAAVDEEVSIEPLYTVRFDARELWEEYSDGDVVHIDMWEGYLSPPEGDASA